MKHIGTMLIALLWYSGAWAQDLILLRNAEEIRAEVREITDPHVLYRLWNGSEEVLSLPRNEIFSITYRNGEKDLFMEDPAPTAIEEYPWPEVSKTYRPGDLFDENGVRGLVISVTDGGRHGLILSLDQKELPWVGEENRQALAGTEKLASGWKIRYVYYGGVELGVADRSDGWRNRVRLFEVLASTGFSLSDFPAFEWCEARGSGWYLPALDELKGLWTLIGGAEEDGKFSLGDYEAARKRFNAYMTQYGGDPYPRLPSFRFWSSTEKDAGRAYGCDVGCSPDIVWRAYRKPYGEILDEGGGKASEWSVRAVHKF